MFFVVLAGHCEAGFVECFLAPGRPCAVVDGAHEQAKGLRVAEEALHAAVSCLLYEVSSVIDVRISLKEIGSLLFVEGGEVQHGHLA